MASTCSVCKVTLNSPFQYQQHLSGKQHAKKLQRQTQGDNPQSSTPAVKAPKSKAKKKGSGPINFVRANADGGLLTSDTTAGAQSSDAAQVSNTATTGAQSSDTAQVSSTATTGAQSSGQSQLYSTAAGQQSCDLSQFYNSLQMSDQMQLYNAAVGQQYSDPSQFYNSAAYAQYFYNANTGKKKRIAAPESVTMPTDPSVFIDNMGVASVEWGNFEGLYCTICAAQLPGKEQAELHYRGQKHMKKAKIARLRELGALEGYVDVNEAGKAGSSAANLKKGGYFFCSFCNITVNSDEQLNIHMTGSRHKKMMEMRKRHLEIMEVVVPSKMPLQDEPSDDSAVASQ